MWNALPDADSSPLFTLDIQNIWQIKSDGQYLAVVRIFDQGVVLYRVDQLSSSATPVAQLPNNASYRFNLPQSVLLADNGLFIADTGFNRVVGWRSINDAINGNPPDAVLGQQNLQDTSPAIGQNRLFSPRGLALHGNRLWVGEFNFSGRLLEFSFTTPGQHTLTVSKSGTGSGTVTSNPSGIDCGSDCSETYNQGTGVTLTATPASGSTFSGWSGACSGTGPCQVTINGPIAVTASFTLKVPHLSVAQTSLDFGSIKAGKKATKTLNITNSGSGNLDGSFHLSWPPL